MFPRRDDLTAKASFLYIYSDLPSFDISHTPYSLIGLIHPTRLRPTQWSQTVLCQLLDPSHKSSAPDNKVAAIASQYSRCGVAWRGVHNGQLDLPVLPVTKYKLQEHPKSPTYTQMLLGINRPCRWWIFYVSRETERKRLGIRRRGWLGY